MPTGLEGGWIEGRAIGIGWRLAAQGGGKGGRDEDQQEEVGEGIALVGAILALGFLVGFSSVHLGGLLSHTSRGSSYSVEAEAASLLDELSELIARCDALLARAGEGQRASSDHGYDYALEGLRSQLYQIHFDLTKLLLKGS